MRLAKTTERPGELRYAGSPAVTIVIPCYNEEKFISGVVRSMLEQDYPAEHMEVLVVDGRSTDRSREIVQALALEDSRVRLIDNPARNKPRALNLGIGEATGDVVIRVDAHAEYPADYVRLCVENLLESGADNVGGLRETRPRDDTLLGQAIALSIKSRFGSGGAVFRSGGSGRRWVDTVFGGCYWRETFDRIGHFDERLLRGQDREFNARLRRAGGRILFVPEIRCVYYARSDLRSFIPWNFVSGMTPFYISRITRTRNWSWRNLAPPALVGALACLPVIALSVQVLWPVWLVIVALYGAATAAASIREAHLAGSLRLVPFLFVVFVLTHLGYGLGALYGAVRSVRADDAWARA